MKILHVADLHLEGGYYRLGNEKNKILREEGLKLFSQLLEVAKQEKVAAVLLCGDLFDKLVVRKSTKKFVIDGIASLPDVKFFYCLGNHDHKSLFEEDCPKNLIIFSTGFEKYDLGEVTIGGSSVIKYAKREFLSKIDFDKLKVNIFMLHAYLSSKKFDDCLTLEAADLKGKNIDYLALGHVHTRLEGRIDSRGEWVYAGNGGKYGFGDYKRGYVLMDIKDHKISWQRKDFQLERDFYDVLVDITSCHNFNDLKSSIEKAVKNIGEKNFVRVIFKGEYDEGFEKHEDILRQTFDERFFYFDIRDDSKIRIDLDRVMAETLSLKAEMIKLIYSSNLTDKQKADCIKLGISALRGEEVEI